MDDFPNYLESRLRNRRILVVEDEASTVVMLNMGLNEAGSDVYLAQNVHRACRFAAKNGIDCALLDIRIGADTVFSVADILADKKVPFVFSSGCDMGALPNRYRDHTILRKPYLFGDVVQVLVASMNSANHLNSRPRFRVVDGDAPEDNRAKPPRLHRY